MASGPYAAPWTGTGRLQSDVDNLNHQKADRHEVASLRGDVDRLERTVMELSAACDGLRSELQTLRENWRQALDILSQMTQVL